MEMIHILPFFTFQKPVSDQRCQRSRMQFTEFCIKGNNYLEVTDGKTAEECRTQCEGIENCLVGNWYKKHNGKNNVCRLFKRDDIDMKTCGKSDGEKDDKKKTKIQENRPDAELIRCSTKRKSSKYFSIICVDSPFAFYCFLSIIYFLPYETRAVFVSLTQTFK